MGVYTVAGNGDLTLAAAIANDTNLWIATQTSYTRSFSGGNLSKVRGQRYAFGLIYVGSGTAPLMMGQNALLGTEAAADPIVGGYWSGQTDLPSSISAGSITGAGHLCYAALLP